MNIKSFNFQNISVSFNESGYLHATVIAQYFNKQVRDYLVNTRTTDYINALIEILSEKGNPLTQSDLIIVKKGNSKNFTQGTWLHPKLAVDFARWLDPKFAVWCDEQIEQIIHHRTPQPEPTQQPLPLAPIPDYDYGMARLFVKHGAGVATVSDLYMALSQLSHIQNTFLKILEHKALHFTLNDAEKRCLDILAHWQMAVASVGVNISK